MKKVMILAIVLIYIASIVVVNFFGLAIKVGESTNYVKEILIDRITMHGYGEDGYTVTPDDAGMIEIGKERYHLYQFPYIAPAEGQTYTAENYAGNPNQVAIYWQVMPTNADRRGVSFLFDEKDVADGKVLFFEEEKTVVFLKPDVMIRLTLRAVDGSNVQTRQFYLMASSKLAP